MFLLKGLKKNRLPKENPGKQLQVFPVIGSMQLRGAWPLRIFSHSLKCVLLASDLKFLPPFSEAVPGWAIKISLIYKKQTSQKEGKRCRGGGCNRHASSPLPHAQWVGKEDGNHAHVEYLAQRLVAVRALGTPTPLMWHNNNLSRVTVWVCNNVSCHLALWGKWEKAIVHIVSAGIRNTFSKSCSAAKALWRKMRGFQLGERPQEKDKQLTLVCFFMLYFTCSLKHLPKRCRAVLLITSSSHCRWRIDST